jgi:hypothetical protein
MRLFVVIFPDGGRIVSALRLERISGSCRLKLSSADYLSGWHVVSWWP